MKLIIDSGSTKTDYTLLDTPTVQYFKTIGFNPFFHSSDFIFNTLAQNNDLSSIANKVNEVHYYGAGCSSQSLKEIVSSAFSKAFHNAEIVVNHDMHAAAIATCGNTMGIACILGTGSNSCFFDGNSTTEKVPALGYLLGDEGSGSHLGKTLLKHYFYNQLPSEIEEALMDYTKQSKKELLQELYSSPKANVHLASFSTFIGEYQKHPFIWEMVERCFAAFLTQHVECFDEYRSVPAHFIGSIAYHFQDILKASCRNFDIAHGTILQKPMEGLIQYHSNESLIS